MKMIKILEQLHPNKKIHKFVSPGRINLIGEHIDYMGGDVVPAAINLKITAFVVKAKKIRINSLNFDNEWVELSTESISNFKYDKKDGFMSFVKGILHEMRYILKPNSGFEMIISSSIPVASGLSSSAAFGMLVIKVLNNLFDLNISRVEQVKLFQRVENNFIGLKSGIMDQFAIEFGKKNNFMLLNTQTLQHKYLTASMNDYKFILISSNKSRELADSSYNQRVEELEQVAHILSKDFNTLARTVEESDLDKIKDPILKGRIRHVFTEVERVNKIVNKINVIHGKLLGSILNESHRSLSDDYGVSSEELNFIHSRTNNLKGVYGGRQIGAGFGGCVLFVVSKKFNIKAIDFAQEYKDKFSWNLDIYSFDIVEGVNEEY